MYLDFPPMGHDPLQLVCQAMGHDPLERYTGDLDECR